MMPWGWAPAQAEPEKAKTAPKLPGPPRACIRRRMTVTWCGQTIEPGVFTFEDSAYAMRFYRTGHVIGICETCAIEYEGVNQLDSSPLRA